MPPFQPGNRYRRGPVSEARKRFARVAAGLLEEHGVAAFLSILRSKNSGAKTKCLELLLAYAIGKPLSINALVHANAGRIDPESPEGILLQLSGQPLPGTTEEEEPDEDEDIFARLPQKRSPWDD